MAVKKLGNDYMLWIESAVAGTYNVILGQDNLNVNRSISKIDTSSKDDQGYATGAFGLRDLSIDLMMKPKLPDPTGYTRLETLALAAPPAPFNVQIRKGGLGGLGTDVVLQILVYGNLDTSSFDLNATASCKVTLTAAAAPTVDALA